MLVIYCSWETILKLSHVRSYIHDPTAPVAQPEGSWAGPLLQDLQASMKMLASAGVISKLIWWMRSFQDPWFLEAFSWTDGLSSLLTIGQQTVLCHIVIFIGRSWPGSFIWASKQEHQREKESARWKSQSGVAQLQKRKLITSAIFHLPEAITTSSPSSGRGYTGPGCQEAVVTKAAH